MPVPSIINVIISVLLANFNLAVNIDNVSFENEGTVLGVSERQFNAPLTVNRSLGFLNKLPENKIVDIPRRRLNSSDMDLLIESGVVVDKKCDKYLWDKNSEELRPIASISKLMTALVFLDNNPGWDEIYTISGDDIREGGRRYLYQGEKVRVKDLFYLSLIASANTATMALVNSTGMSEEEFVVEMNEKSRVLNISNTSFADPSGLSDLNVSNAREVAKLATISFSNQEIRDVVLKRDYTFETINGRKIKIESTDKLLDVFPENGVNIVGGKTGYTNLAGSCFVGEFINKDGREIISVILGGKTASDRFRHTKELVNWTFSSYDW